MNDPHVVALVYRIEHNDSIDCSKAEPFCRNEQGFRLSVAEGRARFEFNDHYPTIATAHEAIADYRRAWEFDAQLKRGPDSFRLILDRGKSELIDRQPKPGRVSLRASFTAGVPSVRVNLRVQSRTYPEPPSDIALSPDTETMHQRFMGYRNGREPLASMASFCLTVIESATGERKNKRVAAAKMYGINKRILDRIGDLSANRGGAEARKADGIAADFSSQERHFLEQAVKAVIRRMAEKEHSPRKQLSPMPLSDLPSLNN